ncbi:MAG: glycosyltransferase family 1 protein [Dehalococcoidia bacterium]|jgi:glycosyltransferase involved in cell wall biosynthesis|nr:MAG: glycosyltransferase family 1 protein [Dehalococcoidia bacterium]
MISEDFLPYIGGISHHVIKLSSALARRGHSVHLLARIPYGYKPVSTELESVKNLLVPTHTFEQGILYGLRHVEFLARGINSMKSLMRHNEFDIVHWHGLWSDSAFAAYSRRISSAKLVFTNHSSMFLEFFSNKLKCKFIKVFLTKPDICIAPSVELADKYKSVFKHVNTIFISNGVDLKTFGSPSDKLKARLTLGLPKEGIIVACPRRLCQKNGVHYLLKAIPYVPENQRPLFVVAGDGPMASDLKNLAETLKVTKHVRFVGAIPYDKMPIFYAASDFAVIPSLLEATSLAALEAMAGGLPVIASAVGGLNDLLENNDAGILVPPANSQVLATAITSLTTNSDSRKRMSVSAKNFALKYSWDEVALQTENAYKSLF